MMMKQKRFIAGAVCPRCSEMDKLVMYIDDNDQQVRECVRCGFTDAMGEDGPEELSTRVNQPRPGEQPLAHEDEVNIIQIMDPGSKRRDH
jgi:hypothetical protein